MNESVKKYLTYGGYIVLVVAVAAFVWLLFRDNRTAPDADQRAGQYIEQTVEQQRKAESEIAAVRKGIDSAQQSAADIADSNSGSAAVADGIADSQQSAQEGITDAEKSADRIEGQSDRIAEASQRAKNNIESAEAANQSAAGALERALQLCRECRESIQEANQLLQQARQEMLAAQKEHERTEKRLRTQKTLWQILAIGLGAWGASR